MLFKEFDLNGKVAVIIGYNQSWTKTLVKAMAENGADVVAVANSVTDMDGVIEEAQRLGRKGSTLSTNITKLESVQNTVEVIMSRFGKIDILINNAAVELVKPFNESIESEWRNIINHNLIGVMLWCRAAGKYMVERRAGRIINIISALSVRGLPNNTVYCATMGAIHQFTKALALEWARHNVRVNAIAHGHMSSEEGNEEVISDRLVRHIPLRRLGKSYDLAGPLVYLSSDASDYITGETFFVDGGLISHG
jgi:NAD(P)-dependent dehydrogenase (short-subunit alcohol dehydrogenase family)